MQVRKSEASAAAQWTSFAVIIVAVLLCATGYYLFQLFFHDDAYISLRYAHNFLHGQELVWNLGERVEGYSNFLWVMLVSMLGLIGIDLVIATKFLGITSLLVCGIITWRFCRLRSPGSSVSPASAALLVLSSLPMIVWSIGGLESVFFALLLLIAIWSTLRAKDSTSRPAILAGLLFALLSMTRPDGPLYLAANSLWLFWYSRRSLIPLLVTFAICFGAFLIWRYSYYGDWMPNPYYVKGDITLSNILRGLAYVRDYSLSLPYLVPLSLFSFFFVRLRRAWQPRHALFLIVISAHLIYVTLVGGDHMPAFRFMVPIIPLCAILIAEAAESLHQHSKSAHRLVPLLVLVTLVTVQVIFPPELVARAKKEDGAAFLGRIVGEYISTNFPKGSLIALNTAGSTPYYAPQHRFIDMLGLNDRTIAKRKDPPVVARWQEVPGHEKGDGAYVLSRKPDYVIAGGSVGYAITMNWFLTEYELARIPEFNAQYKPIALMLPVRQYSGFENYEETMSGEMGFIYYQRMK
jgi:hypothetical protein